MKRLSHNDIDSCRIFGIFGIDGKSVHERNLAARSTAFMTF